MYNRTSLVNHIIVIFLVLSLLVMTFVEIDSAGVVPLKVFHVSQNKGYLLLFLTLFSFGSLCFITSFKICKLDTVSLFLFSKALLDIINYYYASGIDSQTFWYFYSMVFVMPLVYIIFRSYTGTPDTIIHLLSLFAIILVLQEGLTAVFNGIPYSDQEYKTYMRIPIAHSNVIGVVLLSILILRIKLHDKSYKSILINGVVLLGLFLTQSRGCLIFLICWLLYIRLQSYFDKYGRIFIPFAILLCVSLLILIIESTTIQKIIFDVSIQDQYMISIATSGRSDIWELAWQQWFANPIFGKGLGVTEYDIGKEIITTGVHNIILDYAVQSGLVGVFFYFVAVISGIRSKITKTNPIRPALKLALWVMLVYSMFEVTYFNYSCIFLFWMIMGLYNSKQLKYELHSKRFNTNA